MALLPRIVILADINNISADKLNNGEISDTIEYSPLYSSLENEGMYETISGTK